MDHVVFHPGPDGTPAFRRCTSLEAAVGFVEHLRNAEGVTDVAVYALTPVPLVVRAYYKVEVPAGEVPAEAVVDVPEQPYPVEEAGTAGRAAEAAEAGEHSIGFFAQ